LEQEEHFGIYVAESAAVGLVPIDPSVEGQTEYVPKKCRFITLEEAADKISSAFHIPNGKT
jgi:hypothetical protein